MTEIDLEQNTQEWLEFKQETLGASESAAACGLSRYVTPRDFLLFKRSKGEIKVETTENMVLGHEYEEPIAQLLSEFMGRGVSVHTVKMYSKPYLGWITCSPDRKIKDGLYIEIKLKVNGNLPSVPEIEHLVQVHHQMFVLGQEQIYLVYGTRELNALHVFTIHKNGWFLQHEVMKKLLIFRRHWIANPERTEPLPYGSSVHDWTHERILYTFHIELTSYSKPLSSSSSSL